MKSKKGKSQVNAHVKMSIIRDYDFTCIFCGHNGSQSNPLTVDHILPRAEGGTNSQDNLACCCRICNNKKGKMLLTDFIQKYKININRYIENFL